MGVDVVCRTSTRGVSRRALVAVGRRVLELLGRERSELSIALVGNPEIRRLNARYRGQDRPTDVLAFPLEERAPGCELLGDVVISVPKAREQARERGRSLAEEMATLLIHGILHLVGYDHERSPREARAMRRLERKLYRELCESRVLKV
ncbi:MAG TPA: rRNA maturation RNase YbeY [candidate division Zixibacteria bacterium]|nr:rRNA maturation RNase YbeY [candidate division Zixibacteria bacterium]